MYKTVTHCVKQNELGPGRKITHFLPLKYCIDNDGVFDDRLDRWVDRWFVDDRLVVIMVDS